jgi:hypothetical protein
VPLVAIEAIGVAIAFDIGRRFLPQRHERAATAVLAIAVLAIVSSELRPLDPGAPLVAEAQWDRPNVPVRARVTACLSGVSPGDKIMASMGSLGHYMQEMSTSGFAIRDFLHEGNGDIWLAALADGPRRYAAWVLVEEQAEGGDMLARRARDDPRFLAGYDRVCDGAGVGLYKRRSVKEQLTTDN